MRKKFRSIVLTAFLALPVFCHAAQAAVEVGQPAPALVVHQLDGSSFNLAAMKGKVVIVNFWATWCAPCREEMPVLDAFYKQHHGRGVEMIAVSVDRPRYRDEVRATMKDFAFPAAMGGDSDENGFGMPSAIPVTYIVDGNGIIRARLSPDQTRLTDKVLSDAITPLLAR